MQDNFIIQLEVNFINQPEVDFINQPEVNFINQLEAIFSRAELPTLEQLHELQHEENCNLKEKVVHKNLSKLNKS